MKIFLKSLVFFEILFSNIIKKGEKNMNIKSYLCKFISEHKENWKELLSKVPYFLIIKQEGPLAIFNYNMIAEEIVSDNDENEEVLVTRWSRGIYPVYPEEEWYTKCSPFAPDGLMYKVGATIDEKGNVIGEVMNCTRYSCDFTLPEVQEARGIIINVETLEVVCWPFRKFGNYGESYVDTIDWSSARTQEKIDGSITKLWWNEINQNWQVSTNGIIYPNDFYIVGDISFDTLFWEAAEKNNLDCSKLDKDKTYIFELVGPLNRVVIKYEEVDIYHIGTRSNSTGIEYNDDIGIKKPIEYPLNSLEACVKAAEALCDNNSNGKFEIEHEGFVVVDKNWNRIKVKSPEYVMVHHELNGGILSKKKILDLVLENEYEEYLVYFPQYEEVFNSYIKKLEILKSSINEAVLIALKIKDNMKNATRKELAAVVLKEMGKRASWGFKAIDGYDANDIFNLMRQKSIFEELDKINI
jgi:hypothetical protein